MSYQVGAACYESPIAAVQAIASSQLGQLLHASGGTYAVDVVAIGDASYTLAFTALDGGPALSAQAVPLTLQPCGLLTWQDGMTLGWLVVGAWATTYAVKFLWGLFRGEEVANGDA
ncbi:hypothetical protein [Ideonella sp.]|uniref:hypothetical protein n=1 Tax=Ideonella sp. TaxID=1929293 RepID=UPI00351B4B4B